MPLLRNTLVQLLRTLDVQLPLEEVQRPVKSLTHDELFSAPLPTTVPSLQLLRAGKITEPQQRIPS